MLCEMQGRGLQYGYPGLGLHPPGHLQGRRQEQAGMQGFCPEMRAHDYLGPGLALRCISQRGERA
jgi:hypothetical protein